MIGSKKLDSLENSFKQTAFGVLANQIPQKPTRRIISTNEIAGSRNKEHCAKSCVTGQHDLNQAKNVFIFFFSNSDPVEIR